MVLVMSLLFSCVLFSYFSCHKSENNNCVNDIQDRRQGRGGSSRGNDLVAMKIYSGRFFDPKKNSANLWGVFITKQRYNS